MNEGYPAEPSLRERIRNSRGQQLKEVPAAALGVPAIWLRHWPLAERIDFLDWYDHADRRERRAQIHVEAFLLSACDATGTPLFTGADRDWVVAQHLVEASRLGTEALKWNGLWEDDADGPPKSAGGAA